MPRKPLLIIFLVAVLLISFSPAQAQQQLHQPWDHCAVKEPATWEAVAIASVWRGYYTLLRPWLSAMSIAVAGSYIATCPSSSTVSYTITEQLPVGHCPGFGLPCQCTRTCLKKCGIENGKVNEHRCWAERCGGCTYR